MSKFLTFLTCICVAVNMHAQSSASNEIIVEGVAKIKITPDIATITFNLEQNDTTAQRAIRNLNQRSDQLSKSLSKLGFHDNDIQIAEYDISSHLNKSGQKFYDATTTLRLEFQLDNKLLNALYSQVQKEGIRDTDVSFQPKPSDSLEKSTRLRLLQSAIQDGRNHANNIAKELEVKLGKIKHVQKNAEWLFDRSRIDIPRFSAPVVVQAVYLEEISVFGRYQIESVELEEKIILVYEIIH